MKNPRHSMDRKEESHRLAQATTKATTGMTLTTPVHRMTAAECTSTAECRTAGTSRTAPCSYASNRSFVEGRQPYSITRIGMEHALQITYRTLMQYATSQAQYADIRLCHLQSAKDLYGDNSPEVEAVAKAWDIVGVTDGNATGINSIGQKDSLTLDPSPKGEGSWYTLDGRLLEGKPTKKGMYIHNGKKIVVR